MNRYKNNFYCKFSQLHVQIPYKSENSDFCSKHASGGEKGGGGDSKEERKKCENNYTQTGKSKQNRGDKDQPAFDTF